MLFLYTHIPLHTFHKHPIHFLLTSFISLQRYLFTTPVSTLRQGTVLGAGWVGGAGEMSFFQAGQSGLSLENSISPCGKCSFSIRVGWFKVPFFWNNVGVEYTSGLQIGKPDSAKDIWVLFTIELGLAALFTAFFCHACSASSVHTYIVHIVCYGT